MFVIYFWPVYWVECLGFAAFNLFHLDQWPQNSRAHLVLMPLYSTGAFCSSFLFVTHDSLHCLTTGPVQDAAAVHSSCRSGFLPLHFPVERKQSAGHAEVS